MDVVNDIARGLPWLTGFLVLVSLLKPLDARSESEKTDSSTRGPVKNCPLYTHSVGGECTARLSKGAKRVAEPDFERRPV
jgi:hypothetical protein